MLTASIKIPKSSMDKLKRIIERKAAEVVAQVATTAYSYVIENDKPYWSGEYLGSWTVSFGSPSYLRLISAGTDTEKGQGKGADFHYARPKERTILPNYSNPYESIYIVNAALHAYKVEYIGTPTHPQGGWEIATQAVNSTVMSYRFF